MVSMEKPPSPPAAPKESSSGNVSSSEHGAAQTPEHIAKFLDQPIPEKVLTDTKKTINREKMGFIPESHKQTSELYALVHEDGAQENLKQLRAELRAGKTLNEFIKETSLIPIDSKKRESRTKGLTLFGAALRSTYLPETDSDTGSLSEIEKSLVDVAEHLIVTADSLAGNYDGQKDLPGSLVIEKEADKKNKDSNQTSERESLESEQKPINKWKPHLEGLTNQPEQDDVIHKRRVWLENAFNTKNLEPASNLLKAREVITKTISSRLQSNEDVFKKRFNNLSSEENEKIFLKAQKFAENLQNKNKSLVDTIDQAKTVQDFRALKLVSLALLDAAAGKSWSEMTEGQKRIIRTGELIGLEAERKHIALSLKQMKPDAIKRAVSRYEGFINSDDLPLIFKERFEEMTDRIRIKNQEIKPELKISPESRSKKIESKVEEGEKGVLEPVEAIEMPDTNLNEVGQEELKSVTKFIDSFDEQSHYIDTLIAQKKWYNHWAMPVYGQARWIADKIVRFSAHQQVFGLKGGIRSIFNSELANNKMGEIRDHAKRAFEKAIKYLPPGDARIGEYEEHISKLVAGSEMESGKIITEQPRHSADAKEPTVVLIPEKRLSDEESILKDMRSYQDRYPAAGEWNWFIEPSEAADELVNKEATKLGVDPKELVRILWNKAKKYNSRKNVA